MKTLSIIIPVFNEASTALELCGGLVQVLDSLPYSAEVIFIDDGSTDGTFQHIKSIAQADPRFKAIRFGRNFGKSAALSAGIEYAHGDVILTMDGDLQHKPDEIPLFLQKIEEGYDAVIGWRKKRVDSFLTRRLPSWVANKLIAWLSGVALHDFGGTFHAYRKEALKDIELYSGLHRFIPALVSWAGSVKMIEVPITNAQRQYGTSKYGLFRIFAVLCDILVVKYFMSYITRPLQLFGLLGLFFIAIGSVANAYLLMEKLFLGRGIFMEHGPLLISSVFCMLTGLQLVMTGILGEVLTRIYHRTSQRRPYAIRETVGFGRAKSPLELSRSIVA